MHDFFCQKEKENQEEKDDKIIPSSKSETSGEKDSNELKNSELKLLNSAKIIERMLNLNTYEEVARDFRFF